METRAFNGRAPGNVHAYWPSGPVNVDEQLDTQISKGTLLFAQWANTGPHKGGICMVGAAIRGGITVFPQPSNPWDIKNGINNDLGWLYYDNLSGGFADAPTARCLSQM